MKPVDLELGTKLVGGDQKLAEKMLSMLKKDLINILPDIKKAYESKQWNKLYEFIHKLHGGASFCGAPMLKESLLGLEIALRNKEIESIKIKSLYKIFEEAAQNFFDAWPS